MVSWVPWARRGRGDREETQEKEDPRDLLERAVPPATEGFLGQRAYRVKRGLWGREDFPGRVALKVLRETMDALESQGYWEPGV